MSGFGACLSVSNQVQECRETKKRYFQEIRSIDISKDVPVLCLIETGIGTLRNIH